MTSAKTTARFAGALYLLSGIPGVFSYLYLPTSFVVPEDATATAHRITAATLTYRVGILSDLASQVILIVLALTLYDLLKDVDRRYARAMVALAAVGAAVEIANVFNLTAPLILLGSTGASSMLTRPQLDALALAFLQLRGSGLFVAQVFWGLWLFPFGVLVIKSGFFPKILGCLLIVACIAYLAASAAFILLPSHAHIAIHVGQLLGGVGEGAMLLWLLIKGANVSTAEMQPVHIS